MPDKCEKCRLKKYRKHVIACLKCGQEADNHYPVVKPQIIKPLVKNVPLDQFSDKEKITWIASTLLEMTDHRISNILGIHHTTTKSIIARASAKIRGQKKLGN